MFLKYTYTVFLGIILAVFIGVGIAAFYKAPSYPQYPARLQYPAVPLDAKQAPQLTKEQEAYNKKVQEYQIQTEEYNRNVSIIALISSVLFVVISLVFIKRIMIISDGVLFGGILTLLYSIGRGFDAKNDMLNFFVVSVGLVIALVVGYVKFVIPTSKK